jgi:hypothetical protein
MGELQTQLNNAFSMQKETTNSLSESNSWLERTPKINLCRT